MQWMCPCPIYVYGSSISTLANRLRPRQKWLPNPDDKCILLNENVWNSIQMSLKFVPNGPINNIPALFHVMAWCRPGNKPLSEPMMVSLLTHICVTRPQWVNFDYGIDDKCDIFFLGFHYPPMARGYTVSKTNLMNGIFTTFAVNFQFTEMNSIPLVHPEMHHSGVLHIRIATELERLSRFQCSVMLITPRDFTTGCKTDFKII